MPSGTKLGSAYFEFEAQNTQLIGAFVQSEAKAKQASKAIQDAVKKQTDAIKSGSQAAVQAAAAQTRAAQGAMQAAQQAQARYNAMRQAAVQAAQASQAAAAQLNAATTATKSAAGGFNLSAGAALGFAGTLVGVQAGAVGLHAALSALASATKKATDAQFALDKTYGSSAASFTRFGQQLTQTQATTTAEIQRGAAIMGTLRNNYGYTEDQIKTLIKVSLDMAAVTGVDAVEAFKSVQAAMRGEGEAAEKLGFTLNRDAVKAMANMTAEQRKNFETLSDVERAQIIYSEALRQAAPYSNAAAEKARTHAGQIEVLGKRFEELAANLGKLVVPKLGEAAGQTSKLVLELSKVVAEIEKINKTPINPILPNDFTGAIGAGIASGPLALVELIRELIRRRSGIGTAAVREAERALEGLDERAVAGLDTESPGARARRIAAAKERERKIKKEVEDQEDALDDIVRAETDALQRRKEARDKYYDEVRRQAEVAREAELENIEKAKEAAISALEAQKEAVKDALKAAIDAAEREKELRQRTIEEAKEQALDAIDEESKRLEVVRRNEDRLREDSRRQEDRDLSDFRERQDKELEQAHDDERERIERTHEEAVKGYEKQAKAAERKSAAAIRSLEREAEKARNNHASAVRRLERLGEAEEDRHRKNMQQLDDELDARTKALDLQIKALQLQEDQEESARRLGDLREKEAKAQAELTRLKNQQVRSEQEVEESRQALQRLLSTGGRAPEAREVAEQRYVTALAGVPDPEKIKELEEELAELRKDISQQSVKDARDTEIRRLEDLKDKLEDEFEARKRAEEERTRARKRELEADKEAIDDRLKKQLSAIEIRSEKEKDSLKNSLERIRERQDKENEDYELTLERLDKQYEHAQELLEQNRLAEDRAREDRRILEDREREDYRRKEDEALDAQREAIQDAYEAQRLEVEAYYSGPNGVITRLQQLSEATDREYSRQIAAVRVAYEQMREDAEKKYRNAAKTGIIDLIEARRDAEFEALEGEKRAWQDWQNQIQRNIKAVKDDWDAFIRSIGTGPATIPGFNQRPGGGSGGGGGPSSPSDPYRGRTGSGGGQDPTSQGLNPTGAPTDLELGAAPRGPVLTPEENPRSQQVGSVNVDPSRFTVTSHNNSPYNGKFVASDGQIGAAWPGGPRFHRGVDLVISGAKQGGKGQTVGSFTDGEVISIKSEYNGPSDVSGRYVVVKTADGRTHWYMHLDGVHAKERQKIRRGDPIGVLGDAGTEDAGAHLHYEVRSGFHNGDPPGQALDPWPYIRGRDRGGMFFNPTLTFDLRTGAKGLIAERAPEYLVGSRATKMLTSRGLVGGPGSMDYGTSGLLMSSVVGPTTTSGDTWNISGIGLNEAADEIERRQNRRKLLSPRRM